MKANRVSISEAKGRLGDLVKRVAYGGERIIVEFRGRPQAAIISYEDLQSLSDRASSPERQLEALERLARLRERIATRTDKRFDAAADIRELREERLDQLDGLR